MEQRGHVARVGRDDDGSTGSDGRFGNHRVDGRCGRLLAKPSCYSITAAIVIVASNTAASDTDVALRM